jgi:hypothetical protein
MMERTLERRLKREVEKRKAKAWKFVSPGVSGVPDRIILLSGGRAVFIEMKDTGEDLEPLQKKRAQELRALGFEVYDIDSNEKIDDFIRRVFGT